MYLIQNNKIKNKIHLNNIMNPQIVKKKIN